MTIRPRQIGTASSTENQFLQLILNQLERLTQVTSASGGLPTSSAGLPSGAIWSNSNVLTIVP